MSLKLRSLGGALVLLSVLVAATACSTEGQPCRDHQTCKRPNLCLSGHAYGVRASEVRAMKAYPPDTCQPAAVVREATAGRRDGRGGPLNQRRPNGTYVFAEHWR